MKKTFYLLPILFLSYSFDAYSGRSTGTEIVQLAHPNVPNFIYFCCMKQTFLGLSADWWNVIATSTASIIAIIAFIKLLGDGNDNRKAILALSALADAQSKQLKYDEIDRRPWLVIKNDISHNGLPSHAYGITIENRGGTAENVQIVSQDPAVRIVPDRFSKIEKGQKEILQFTAETDRRVREMLRHLMFVTHDSLGNKFTQELIHMLDSQNEISRPQKTT